MKRTHESTSSRPDALHLKSERVEVALRALPGWRPTRHLRGLAVTYRFAEGRGALRFLRRVALLAERQGACPSLVLTSAGRCEIELAGPRRGEVGETQLACARGIAALAAQTASKPAGASNRSSGRSRARSR